MNNKVLIVGTNHHNTLGLIESFGVKGISPYVILCVINDREEWVLKSRYIEKSWVFTSEEDVIKTMLQNFHDRDNKTIVIAASDKLAVLLDKNFAKLTPFFIIPTVKEVGTLADWMSKSKMATLANRVGLTTPESWIIRDNHFPSAITYPCITKAISSVEGSKRDMFVCHSECELRAFLNSQNHCKEIQISEYIDKDFEFQFLGCSLGGGDNVVISGRTHIVRPNAVDNTYFLRFDKVEKELKEIENKVIDFIKQTGYSGPFSVEFLRGKDGKNYFTEMNFRNDGNAICQTAAGINIPYIYYLYYSNGDYQKEIENSEIKTTWLMPELFYFKFLLKREFGVKEWWRNMKKTTSYTTFFKEDKRPFFAYIAFLAKQAIIKDKSDEKNL